MKKGKKKLLQHAGNRYSVRCTTLTGVGIGGVGLFVLAMCLGFAAMWLLVLFAVLSVLTEATVVILFVVFEKSALLAEETPSRYSLTVKRMTYRAACKIFCAAIVPAVCAALLLQWITGRTVTLASVWVLPTLLVLLLPVPVLAWLAGRGREFFTAEETAATAHNKKLARKLFAIGGVICAVLLAATFALSAIAFTHTERRQECTDKDAFLRATQTVEMQKTDAADYGVPLESDGDFGNYFVDVRAALATPPVDPALHDYPIEGDLYLRYHIDYESISRCYVVYIPDLAGKLEVGVYYGRILFRDVAQFARNYPAPTARDLLAGMERDEVFFVLERGAGAVADPAETGNGNTTYACEYEIEVSENGYALLLRETRNYPFISLIGAGGAILTAAICLCIYRSRRQVAASS